MISVEQALGQVCALGKMLETEWVPLSQANGRVLAQDVFANITQPPFAASVMDGYAVRSEDALSGEPLEVVGESAAGKRFDGEIKPYAAVRIFTGAPVPKGADRVVIQEDVTSDGNQITINKNADENRYIRQAGADFAKGDRFAAPRRLGHSEIALLASMNIAKIPVIRKPIVAIIATGNELVIPGERANRDQIISSNNFGLKAMLEDQGADVRMLPIARDNVESLKQTLSFANTADLIVTLGGASVGDHDLVQSVAIEMGLKVDFYKIAMRPGKPLMAGLLDEIPMVGLPGNPVSSMVCGHIFLRPLINVMLGFDTAPLQQGTARLEVDIGPNGKREHYMRANVSLDENGWKIKPQEKQDSALLSILSESNALLVRPAHDPALNIGQNVAFIPLTFTLPA